MGISAFTAANSLLAIVWAIPTGMVNVSRMLISISVGEEDRKTLTDTMRNAFFHFVPLMCAIIAVVMALAVPLTRLYYQDPGDPVFNMTVWGFRILPLCMPLALVRMHLSCYGQATDRNAMVNILEALDGFITVSAFSAILIPSAGIIGLYLATVLNGIISIFYLFGYAAIKIRRFPRNMEEFMVIPPDFGVPEDQRLDHTILDMDGVIQLSEKVHHFCLDRGIDQRRAYFAGLFMEEMAGNVVAHGFHKDKKNHSVDLRVVHKNDVIILRIRDDCVPFDPVDRQKIFDPEDITKNIGIRIVYGIATDISHQNILGLNVLTIRI